MFLYVQVTVSPAPSVTVVLRAPRSVVVYWCSLPDMHSIAVSSLSGSGSSANVHVCPAARMNEIRPGLPFEAVRKNSLPS